MSKDQSFTSPSQIQETSNIAITTTKMQQVLPARSPLKKPSSSWGRFSTFPFWSLDRELWDGWIVSLKSSSSMLTTVSLSLITEFVSVRLSNWFSSRFCSPGSWQKKLLQLVVKNIDKCNYEISKEWLWNFTIIFHNLFISQCYWSSGKVISSLTRISRLIKTIHYTEEVILYFSCLCK